jgi:hypothetical protein
MVGVSDFMDLRQLFNEFQMFSLPEHWYLNVEKWQVYFFALAGIVAIAFLFNLIRIVLKLHFFRYIYNLDGLGQFVWLLGNAFSIFAVIFIIFGIIFVILGSSVPDSGAVNILSIVFIVLTVVFGLARLFRGDSFNSIYGGEDDLFNKVLNGLFVLCLCITYSCLALSVAYTVVPSDSNLIYGHVSADIKSEYNMGDTDSIPVKIGGPDTGLAVTLLSDDSNGLHEISSLILYSNNTSTQFNNTLIGNAMGAGDYLIFLNNTTSLSPGHYRFTFENPKYKQINLSSPFVLKLK